MTEKNAETPWTLSMADSEAWIEIDEKGSAYFIESTFEGVEILRFRISYECREEAARFLTILGRINK